MKCRIFLGGACLLGLLVAAACSGIAQSPPAATPEKSGTPVSTSGGGKAMNISSTAFTEGSSIPKKYTCDGENVSPPLTFGEVPAGAQTLALVADDPDAPAGTWVHWVVFNLPPNSGGLPEAVPAGQTLAAGGQQGTTSFNRSGYGGPCPPSGTHRYFFKLYALDTRLNLTATAKASDLQKALEGHVVAQAQVMGRYQRSK